MARKRGRKRRRSKGLGGFDSVVPATRASNGSLTSGQLGIGLLALAGGNVLGAVALGKHSLIPSAVALGIGIWRKNIYWTMAGAGMLLANGYQPQAPASSGTDGLDGDFSISNFTEQAKERARNYFASFAEKLYLPKPGSVNGLNGEEESVSYFVNPFTPKGGELDMTALDTVQQQIEMNGTGVGEFDLSEKIY